MTFVTILNEVGIFLPQDSAWFYTTLAQSTAVIIALMGTIMADNIGRKRSKIGDIVKNIKIEKLEILKNNNLEEKRVLVERLKIHKEDIKFTRSGIKHFIGGVIILFPLVGLMLFSLWSLPFPNYSYFGVFVFLAFIFLLYTVIRIIRLYSFAKKHYKICENTIDKLNRELMQ